MTRAQGKVPPAAPAGAAALLTGLFTTSIYANYIWSVLNLTLAKGLRFAGILICIRQVGMLTWGQVAATLVAVSFMGFLVDQGLSGSPQIFKMHDRSLDGALLRKISLYRISMAAAIVVFLQIAVHAGLGVTGLVATYAFVLLPRALNIEWLFHRREQYHLTMVISAFRTLVFFGLVAWLVSKDTPARTIILLEVASEAAGVVFSYAMLRRMGPRESMAGAPGLFSMTELLLFSLPILVTGVLDTIPASADIFFLKLFGGYEIIGQYDIGGKVGTFYFFFGAALIQIILPKLARLHAAGDEGRMGEILRSSSKLLLFLTTALLIPSFYYSAEIVRFVFKKDFPLTIFTFTWIPVWVYVSCMAMLNTIVLLAAGRRREYLTGASLACIVNVLGNWLFIGLFAGHGVVFARILSETVFLAYSFRKLPAGIRSGYSRELGLQVANLLLLVGLFLGCNLIGQRELFFALSLAAFALLVWRQRTFSRATLGVLTRN